MVRLMMRLGGELSKIVKQEDTTFRNVSGFKNLHLVDSQASFMGSRFSPVKSFNSLISVYRPDNDD